jgi:hypothetical protein
MKGDHEIHFLCRRLEQCRKNKENGIDQNN